ncbi:MAG: ATP-binding cassette domain-containing protein [Raineya sp.]|jgi:putative ABC transport system ATP-binding protein|nr:ATP-binding cassette domain-containing protein [Raineya sp.]
MFEISGLTHEYQAQTVLAVEKWQAGQGEQWLVLGKSGSGKSTLLHILAGLLKPSKGKVKIKDTFIESLKSSDLDSFRAQNIGIVFQKPHLIQTLTVLENLLLVPYLARKGNKQQIISILESLNMAHKQKSYPNQLSQGELQRISIARAIIHNPVLLLADEPTASLDDENAHNAIGLLQNKAQEIGATLLIATHDQRVKNSFSHTYIL